VTNFYITRQPIFTRTLDVFGYELLYRAAQQNQAVVEDQDKAAVQVILNTFADIGLELLIGNTKAFINLSRNFLIGNLPIPLLPGKVVFEVPEGTQVDPQLVNALAVLTQKGYETALDNVTSIKKIYPLLAVVRMVKINLKEANRTALSSLIFELRQYPLKLVAVNVDTQLDYDYALRLGFDYLQGYFLCKPSLVQGKRLDPSRLIALQSIAMLQDPKATFETLEGVVSQDVVLSYKLIKLVNSAYYSFNTQVKSPRQAISLLGINKLKGWLSLLVMAKIKNKPHELSAMALQRARMAEGLSRAMGEPQTDTYFLVGLLSTLDALMDLSMEKVLANIPLSDEVVTALLTHQGKPGKVLHAILAYEQGIWEPVNQLKINSEKVTEIYVDSIRWSLLLSKISEEENK
jgi:c-di-GMP phosphodiesterase